MGGTRTLAMDAWLPVPVHGAGNPREGADPCGRAVPLRAGGRDRPAGGRPRPTPLARASLRLVRRAGREALDLLLPPACLACTARVDAHGGLCPRCWSTVRWVERPFCEITGAPMAVDLGPGMLSPAAIAAPPPYERARSAAMFDETARGLVHRLKYRDETGLARWMARWMVRPAAELAADCDALVPVPLHARRTMARKFNQSAELTRALAPLLDLPHRPEWLVRSRPTRRQVGLGHAARRRNVQGAFGTPDAQRPALKGARVLLVDDVLTTGATAAAASRALLRGGARAVDVLTFARVADGDDGTALAEAVAALTIEGTGA